MVVHQPLVEHRDPVQRDEVVGALVFSPPPGHAILEGGVLGTSLLLDCIQEECGIAYVLLVVGGPVDDTNHIPVEDDLFVPGGLLRIGKSNGRSGWGIDQPQSSGTSSLNAKFDLCVSLET